MVYGGFIFYTSGEIKIRKDFSDKYCSLKKISVIYRLAFFLGGGWSMKKKSLKLMGMAALAMSLMVSAPVNAKELQDTDLIVQEATPEDAEEIAMATNGWVKNSDGTYNYYANGTMLKNTVKLIGDKYYFFNSSGVMLDNGSASLYDANEDIYNYYRAKEGGALYSGEWYGSTYYNVGGKRARGATVINGRTYYFSSSGYLQTSGEVVIDGVTYTCNSAGVLVEVKTNGWVYENKKWYYKQDGVNVKSKILEIGGKRYAFNASGEMYSGREFYISPYYYRAGVDGSLITGWYNGDYGTYYYDENGRRASGSATIDGVTYYFTNGYLATEGIVSNEYSEASCTVSKKDNSTVKISGAGWHKVDNCWYYIKKDGWAAMDEMLEISGKKYYFTYNGTMLSNGEKYYDGGYIRASATGELYSSTWYNVRNAPGNAEYPSSYVEWVYYGQDCKTLKGIQTIGGKKYLFDTLGYLVQNSFYKYDGVMYKTDRNGIPKAVSDGWHQDADGEWAYIKNGSLYSSGEYVIDGKKYFFSNSRMFEGNRTYYKNGKYYLLNAAGQLIDTPGWHKINGDWYYVTEDTSVHNGLLSLNGYTYYLEPELVCNRSLFYYAQTLYKVNGSLGNLTAITADGIYSDGENTYCVSDGMLYAGWKKEGNHWCYYDYEKVVNSYIYEDGKYYYFDNQGRLYVNTWIMDSYGSTRYAKSSGAIAYDESLVIDGKTYHFNSNGNLYQDSSIATKSLDYTYYDVNNKPVKVSFKNGWNLLGGKYYYVLNGELVKSKQMVINGRIYYFDYTGIMKSDEKYSDRIYGKDGAALTGWIQWRGDWYYADTSTGYLVEGLRKIGKYEYYFEKDAYGARHGIMCTTEAMVNGYKYIFNSNGTVKSISNPAENGWIYVNGDPVYCKDGYPYTGWLGDYYLVVGKKVIRDTISWNGNVYFLGDDGKYMRSTWIDAYDGYRIYIKSNGAVAMNEWITIGGKWYYFDSSRYAVRGIKKIGKTTYYFDKTGKMIKSYNSLTEGWNQVNGDWFYVQDGEVIMNGTKYIKGKWYSFEEGIMIKNNLGYYEGEYYYFDANGVRSSAKGWQKVNGKWTYFDANGAMCQGWITVDGKKYYLDYSDEYDSTFMVTGTRIIDNYKCVFDSNGVLTDATALDEGWQKLGGKWYYIEDTSSSKPDLVRFGRVKVGDDIYFVDDDGVMLTNCVVKYNECLYFHGADGKLVRKAGIYKDTDGKSVYVTADGKAHIGDVYINGVVKFMDAVWKLGLTESSAY